MRYYVLFDKKSGTSKKITKFNHAHKMVETFGKSHSPVKDCQAVLQLYAY